MCRKIPAPTSSSIASRPTTRTRSARRLTYSLVAGVGGEDNALFSMVNGEVRFNAAPDFEAPADANGDNVYNILVGVSDGVGAFTTKAVTVHVTNSTEGANTAPTITTTPGNPLLSAENTARRRSFTTPITSTRTRSTTSPSSISAGADAALFSFDTATGQLRCGGITQFRDPDRCRGQQCLQRHHLAQRRGQPAGHAECQPSR